MAETATFDEFVMVRSRHLLRVAYLLTGDHALAEDLLQTTLVKSWGAWPRIDGNPEPYVRTILANTYNSWWRRRWHLERPTDELPEQTRPAPQGAVDERDQIWRALSRLPRQQRLVLVLRYFEDLSEADIARTLGVSAGSVKTHAAKGLAKLRLDPSLRTLPLPDDEAPAGNQRLVAVRQQLAGRRRRRIAGVAAAACLAVLALIAAYALVPQLDRNALPEPAFPVEVPGYLSDRATAAAADVSYFRVVASSQHGYADRLPAALTWTPGSRPQELIVDCEQHSFVPVTVVIWVGDLTTPVTTCTRSDGPIGTHRISLDTTRLGLVAGRPATMTAALAEVRPLGSTPKPLPPGTLTLVIAEAIPFAEYPLPTPPAVLPPLSSPFEFMDPAGATVLASGGAHSATLIWRGEVEIWTEAQTLGRLRLAVDGAPLMNIDWTEYEPDGTLRFGISLDDGHPTLSGRFTPEPGKAITITVDAERMTGDWRVVVRPYVR